MTSKELVEEKKRLAQKKSYSFEDLREIMAILRDPKGGCPWDRAQTHDSLKKCFQDEVDEVFGGIDRLDSTGDGENLCEELGDVLMHILLQARIAEQEGIFTTDDVIEGISRKMIRRHPHVFSETKDGAPSKHMPTWDEIKADEKAGRLK